MHTEAYIKRLAATCMLLRDKADGSKVALDADGKSKGYGYVHFAGEDGAKNAIEMLDEIEICGQKVRGLNLGNGAAQAEICEPPRR